MCEKFSELENFLGAAQFLNGSFEINISMRNIMKVRGSTEGHHENSLNSEWKAISCYLFIYNTDSSLWFIYYIGTCS